MNAQSQSFTELNVYKKSRQLRIRISELCKHTFPKEEKYLLIDQIKRSSRSVTANIAEGHGRYHYQENIQFCRIARGSLYETKEHLLVAVDEAYIDAKGIEELEMLIVECLKLLNGYIKFLTKMKIQDKKK